MSKITTISGTVTHSVVLGQHGVRATLVVTDTGVILPAAVYGVTSSYGDAGIVVRPKLDGASITNMGTVSGGAGRVYGQYKFVNGGIGIDAAGVDTAIDNNGLITGGLGGYFNTRISAGGIGVDLSGAGSALLNTGEIKGGTGLSYFDGGAGGDGVTQSAAGTLTNNGTIAGGNGGNGYSGEEEGSGGNGGVGLDLNGAGAFAVNHGVVSGGLGGFGGYGDGRDGNGVDVSKGAGFTNDGTVTGQDGLYASHGGVVVNNGAIAANATQYPSPGVLLASGSALINNGTIMGGRDVAAPYFYRYPPSSDGVDAGNGCTLTNNGTITGGANGNAGESQGGVGVSIDGNAKLVNTGLIAGGQTANYSGGNGLDLSNVTHASSSGTIMGGYGATGVYVRNSVFDNTGLIEGGKDSGVGVILGHGSVVNAGTIAGGNGSSSSYNAGLGVQLAAGTLTNAGTIAGGVIDGRMADAVLVSGTATLAIEPNAVFDGAVVANIYLHDVLQLTGTGAGVLLGLGSEFVDFTTIQETAGANWTLGQTNVLATPAALAVAGALTVTGSLADASVAAVFTCGSLLAAGNATVQIGGIALAGGRLGGASGSEIVVGAAGGGAKPGQILVESGAAITGSGAVNGALGVMDNGLIEAQGGTLTIGIPVSGTGTLDIGNGATLQTGGAVQVPSIVFAAGSGETFYVAKPGSLTGTLSGFGTRDVIDLKDLQATSASFLAGTLTLLDGTSVVGSLAFAGNYDTANFAVSYDQHGGTIIDFVANPGAHGGLAGAQERGPGAMPPIEDSHGGAWLAAWLAQPFH